MAKPDKEELAADAAILPQASLSWPRLFTRTIPGLAVGPVTAISGIIAPERYDPVLDCFFRGLPHAYRNVEAPSGTILQIKITGECGGDWFLDRKGASWTLVTEPFGDFAAQVNNISRIGVARVYERNR
jgi:hypothetical protein